jgi:hypothetical protein
MLQLTLACTVLQSSRLVSPMIVMNVIVFRVVLVLVRVRVLRSVSMRVLVRMERVFLTLLVGVSVQRPVGVTAFLS